MKKVLLAAAAAAAGALVFVKLRSARSEDDLWHEATTG